MNRLYVATNVPMNRPGNESSSVTAGGTTDTAIDGLCANGALDVVTSSIHPGIRRSLADHFVTHPTARRSSTPSRKHAERRMRESAACKSWPCNMRQRDESPDAPPSGDAEAEDQSCRPTRLSRTDPGGKCRESRQFVLTATAGVAASKGTRPTAAGVIRFDESSDTVEAPAPLSNLFTHVAVRRFRPKLTGYDLYAQRQWRGRSTGTGRGTGTCLPSLTSVVVREICHDLYMNDRLCSERGALVANTISARRMWLESRVCEHYRALRNRTSPRRHVATSVKLVAGDDRSNAPYC